MKISVYKYGGVTFTSEVILNSQHFWQKETRKGKILFVVSAMKGMTRLLNLIIKNVIVENTAKKNEKEFARLVIKIAIEEFEREHAKLISEIFLGKYLEEAKNELKKVFDTMKDCISMYHGKGDTQFYPFILKFGEVATSRIFSIFLNSIGITNSLLYAPDYLKTTGFSVNARLKELDNSFVSLFEKNDALVVQGFIGKDIEGKPTTLGLDGSDLSASYFGGGILDSGISTSIIFWKDVEKIYYSDPFVDPNAISTHSMAFSKYKKLSTRPIRLDAVKYALKKNIPVYMGYILDPYAPKSRIY